MSFASVCSQVLVLFFLMGLGWLFAAVRFVDQEGVRQMTRILCYIVSPCLIVNCFQMKFSEQSAHGFLVAESSLERACAEPC